MRKPRPSDAPERRAAYRAANKVAIQEYAAEYKAKNAEAINTQRAEYRVLNAESLRAKSAAYCEANRASINARQNAKRAADRASRPSATDEQRAAKKAAQAASVAAYKKAWAAENAERLKSQRHEKYLANRTANIAKAVAWARANKDKRTAILARCAEKHPEHRRTSKVNRRTRERAAPGDRLTPADVATLLKSQRGKCATCRCGIAAGYEIDHIEPISRGGTNHRLNFQLLCRTCNRTKGAKDPIAFMQQRGFLL